MKWIAALVLSIIVMAILFPVVTAVAVWVLGDQADEIPWLAAGGLFMAYVVVVGGYREWCGAVDRRRRGVTLHEDLEHIRRHQLKVDRASRLGDPIPEFRPLVKRHHRARDTYMRGNV